jgi:hypothetical protein
MVTSLSDIVGYFHKDVVVSHGPITCCEQWGLFKRKKRSVFSVVLLQVYIVEGESSYEAT